MLLAKSSAWKRIVDMSEKLIVSEGPFSVTFQLRAVALFRLKMFDELAHEVGVALQAEEILVEGDDSSKNITLNRGLERVIALHLLLIEIKAMTGRGDEALSQLYGLQRWLLTCSSTEPVQQWWKWRIVWAIVNNLVKQRQWRQAIRELKALLESVHKSRFADLPAMAKGEILSAEVIITCRISRIFVQVGYVREIIN